MGLASRAALAQDASCKQARELDLRVNPIECVCDERLKNVKGTLPQGMTLIAACNLHWYPGNPVNLTKEVASLDTVPRGNIPEGIYVLAGERTYAGKLVLTIEPGNPHVIFHLPASAPRGSTLFLQTIAEGITFEDDARARLRAPERLQAHKCSQAQLQFKAQGLEVIFGADRVVALGADILQVSPYTDCTL
jgi:hypothetical protein